MFALGQLMFRFFRRSPRIEARQIGFEELRRDINFALRVPTNTECQPFLRAMRNFRGLRAGTIATFSSDAGLRPRCACRGFIGYWLWNFSLSVRQCCRWLAGSQELFSWLQPFHRTKYVSAPEVNLLSRISSTSHS